MTDAAAAPARANTPKPAIQVSAPSAHSTASSTHKQQQQQSPPSQVPPAPTQSPHTNRPTQPPPQTNRRPGRSATLDYLSDKHTAAFIRRTLCPPQSGDKSRGATVPIEDLLPPLTSRNDVDLQLYAFLAIILREFVLSWYTKITPDDTFVAEVVQIVAHCTRALEQRLRKVDLESLLFDEIPDLLDRHITARRVSRHAIARPPTVVDPREVYHSLCPLPYLSPVPRPDAPETVTLQEENEAAYRRLLVQGVLAILLPTEDLENPCLTSLVGQVLSETIIGNVIANKASQPWLIWEGLSILAKNTSRGRRRQKTRAQSGEGGSHRQSRSGQSAQSHAPPSYFLGLLFSAIHWIVLVYSSIRLLVMSLASASKSPRRAGRSTMSSSSIGSAAGEKGYLPTAGDGSGDTTLDGGLLGEGHPVKVPVLRFRIWACVANLVGLQSRMPWLSGAIAMVQLGLSEGPGRIADLDGVLDRSLSHHLQSLLSPTRLPPLLRSLRAALFPNNAPGTPTLQPPANDAELLALRRRTAILLADLIPPRLYALYFSGRPPWGDGGVVGGAARGSGGGEEPDPGPVEEVLDLFGDEYCNKHLMYGVLELVLVRLMPELAERRADDLMADRLG